MPTTLTQGGSLCAEKKPRRTRTPGPKPPEAAAVDGANWWPRTRYVTLPMMRNIIAITALFSLIVTFANFDIVRILTAGGPIDQTHIVGGLIESGAHRTVTHLADPAADVGLTRLILFGVSPKCAPTDFDEVKRAGSSIAPRRMPRSRRRSGALRRRRSPRTSFFSTNYPPQF